MPFYEYEYMLEDIKEIQVEQEKQQEEQEKKHGDMTKSMNPSRMMSQIQQGFKMPSSSISMPKVNIPKL